MKQYKADLHTHTIASDGALTAEQLVSKAADAGVDIISITDHDSIESLEPARLKGEQVGVEVIPGVELSLNIEERDVHLLAYFFDPANSDFRNYLLSVREARFRRAERIVSALHKLNVNLPFEAVLSKAGSGTIGRFHIALALLELGYVSTYQNAFTKYLGFRAPAYEKNISLPPEELFSLVTGAGGLTFIAHPGKSFSDSVLQTLIKLGVDGIEVIHPSHSPALTNYYRSIASEYCLLESGGSDYHGGERQDDYAFGTVTIPITFVETMRHRLFQTTTILD
ncbi:MAG: PHP domain-containing protein [Ignavibacteriales bacterium]|nr:PHP domain-containing protein [Ignavibacteriales bacterium]